MNNYFKVGASGTWEGDEDKYYIGRRANGSTFHDTGTSEMTNVIIYVDLGIKAVEVGKAGIAASAT
jgi:hypothetical protein